MKILVILTGRMCFDGITTSVYNYYDFMERSDMVIDIVAARGVEEEIKNKFEMLGIRIFQLSNRDNGTFLYTVNLINIIRRGKYDIVHAHGNSATLALEMIAAKIAGCKVRIVHSRNSFCEHTKIDKILRPVMYAFYTDGFACGEKAGRWLFNNHPFTIINNGKDIDCFLFNEVTRKKYREKLNVDLDTVLLGHVGLFHKQKNHTFLIDIFEKVCARDDNYRLVLIGEGEEQEYIKDLVNNKGLRKKVLFLGKQSNVCDWLQALDIMVFPSLYEGFPNVVLEWQLAGLPSIISDRITNECKLTNLVKYLSIESKPEIWAETIINTQIGDRKKSRDYIKKIFVDAGFDIKENAVALKKKYQKLVDWRKK